MTKTVEMIFDFVSPNAYLAWHPLKDVIARTGAVLKVTPAFLGGMHKLTGNQPPMVAFANVKGKNAYMMLEIQRWMKKHGLNDFRMNPHFPMMTVPALRALLVAGEDGRDIEFIDRLLPHVWERGANIADTDILANILTAEGFDAKSIMDRTQGPEIKQKLVDNTESAVERGAFGIPTFFVGGEMYFGKDRLDGVEEELTR